MAEEQAGGLPEARIQVLDRCLHALRHAKTDSHTIAALLLITRLCPATHLDQPTLTRILEAVGPTFPARLLVTSLRGHDLSDPSHHHLLSLGTTLLASLSLDPQLTSRPQVLATIPLLLDIVSTGLQNQARPGPQEPSEPQKASISNTSDLQNQARPGSEEPSDPQETSRLDEAVAADCYQVLTAVCALPQGPRQLLSRGAVPALCRALDQNRALSHQRALPLLGCLLSGETRSKAWNQHPAELLSLLTKLSTEFCQTPDSTRLGMCARLVPFLPPPGAGSEGEVLRASVSRVWVGLRPVLQAKLTPRQIGPVLVLSSCLLDLGGWDLVGPPKFCCLLVNRACVEVRMGLEEPPGSDVSPELQNTLTACYRIMEAAMEQACIEGAAGHPALSLQQSQQVLRVLEETFSGVIFYLQQVDPSRYGDLFVFATFRALCSWLAEETSCLKEEVTALLPLLIDYARCHLQARSSERGASDWLAQMSISEEGGAWTGEEPLRYLLPALCHLSAEEGPRKVLLTLDTPALLVVFLLRTWTSLKRRGDAASSNETACSALLNFTVTEPDVVRKDPAFRTLQTHLSQALPVLVNKPHLLVLAANYVTLGLMIDRLTSHPSGPVEDDQRRFFSAALRFLSGALEPGSGSDPVHVTVTWEEAVELWRLSLQALSGCVQNRPQLIGTIREERWFGHTVTMLAQSKAPPDPNTQEVLEEVLSTMVERSAACKQEVHDLMRSSEGGALSRMRRLRESVGL